MTNNHQNLIIDIETCTNCNQHTWCTRHDETKYNQHYQKLKYKIQTQLNHAIIYHNIVPTNYRKVQFNQYHMGENRYYDEENEQFVQFPRFGAFQIYVDGMLIFSKLKSTLWPKHDRIFRIIQLIQQQKNNGGNIDKYSLQQRLQNDQDLDFKQTYKGLLKDLASSQQINNYHQGNSSLQTPNKRKFITRKLQTGIKKKYSKPSHQHNSEPKLKNPQRIKRDFRHLKYVKNDWKKSKEFQDYQYFEKNSLHSSPKNKLSSQHDSRKQTPITENKIAEPKKKIPHPQPQNRKYISNKQDYKQQQQLINNVHKTKSNQQKVITPNNKQLHKEIQPFKKRPSSRKITKIKQEIKPQIKPQHVNPNKQTQLIPNTQHTPRKQVPIDEAIEQNLDQSKSPQKPIPSPRQQTYKTSEPKKSQGKESQPSKSIKILNQQSFSIGIQQKDSTFQDISKIKSSSKDSKQPQTQQIQNLHRRNSQNNNSVDNRQVSITKKSNTENFKKQPIHDTFQNDKQKNNNQQQMKKKNSKRNSQQSVKITDQQKYAHQSQNINSDSKIEDLSQSKHEQNMKKYEQIQQQKKDKQQQIVQQEIPNKQQQIKIQKQPSIQQVKIYLQPQIQQIPQPEKPKNQQIPQQNQQQKPENKPEQQNIPQINIQPYENFYIQKQSTPKGESSRINQKQSQNNQKSSSQHQSLQNHDQQHQQYILDTNKNITIQEYQSNIQLSNQNQQNQQQRQINNPEKIATQQQQNQEEPHNHPSDVQKKHSLSSRQSQHIKQKSIPVQKQQSNHEKKEFQQDQANEKHQEETHPKIKTIHSNQQRQNIESQQQNKEEPQNRKKSQSLPPQIKQPLDQQKCVVVLPNSVYQYMKNLKKMSQQKKQIKDNHHQEKKIENQNLEQQQHKDNQHQQQKQSLIKIQSQLQQSLNQQIINQQQISKLKQQPKQQQQQQHESNEQQHDGQHNQIQQINQTSTFQNIDPETKEQFILDQKKQSTHQQLNQKEDYKYVSFIMDNSNQQNCSKSKQFHISFQLSQEKGQQAIPNQHQPFQVQQTAQKYSINSDRGSQLQFRENLQLTQSNRQKQVDNLKNNCLQQNEEQKKQERLFITFQKSFHNQKMESKKQGKQEYIQLQQSHQSKQQHNNIEQHLQNHEHQPNLQSEDNPPTLHNETHEQGELTLQDNHHINPSSEINRQDEIGEPIGLGAASDGNNQQKNMTDEEAKINISNAAVQLHENPPDNISNEKAAQQQQQQQQQQRQQQQQQQQQPQQIITTSHHSNPPQQNHQHNATNNEQPNLHHVQSAYQPSAQYKENDLPVERRSSVSNS